MAQSEFLKVALEAVKKAEEVIMKYYSGKIKVKLKSDQTPLTLADTEAEKVIIETIKGRFPEHGFLGEESGNNKTRSEYHWLVDPIDGTKNYVRKIPVFGTQLALMKGNEVILGVSNAPALKELVYAERGSGSFLNGEPIHVSKVSDISKAMICYGGLKHFIKKGFSSNLLELINTASRDRSFGDFYMYHLVASGRADAVVEAAIAIWDVAALELIIEEAGGKMTDMRGNPVGKDISTVIATNRLLHDAVLKYFSK